MSYFLFLLVNATLFIRPAELVPSLEALPLYNWLIIACLAVSFPQVLQQFQPEMLRHRPIHLFVLGMLLAVAFSHLSHLNLWSTHECVSEFSKVIVYYFLFVGLIDTPQRLKVFLLLLIGLITIVAALALLQYHHVISIPALEVLQETDIDPDTGEVFLTPRLRSTGIYNDPNDLSMILVVGIVLGTHCLFNPAWGLLRPLWLAPIGAFGYSLALTQSRGGLLSLAAALLVLLQTRYGWRKAILAGAVALPALFILFGGGRQTDIGGALAGDTGHTRLQLWSEGLVLFRSAPVFGIGQGEFDEEVGQVAHNSFMHAYTELGFFGGTIFFATFFYPAHTLHRLRRADHQIDDPALAAARPFMLAIIAAYAASMLSLSRTYVVPTYMVVGLSSAYCYLTGADYLLPKVTFDMQLVRRMTVGSLGTLAALYLFVRAFR